MTSNSPTHAERRAALARRMKQPGLVVAPGVFELISARIADPMGFDCLYVTGYGLVASHLGLPDAEAARAELTERGVVFHGETFDTGVCHMAHFSDPDGNVLMLHRRYAPRD